MYRLAMNLFTFVCLYISPLIIITSFQVIIITTQIENAQKATLKNLHKYKIPVCTSSVELKWQGLKEDQKVVLLKTSKNTCEYFQ